MDVSDPSNFKRLQALFEEDYNMITANLTPFSLNDSQIKESIRACHIENDYLLDPHSAIGYAALKVGEEEGVFLCTAHFCKFLPVMQEALNEELQIPDFAVELMTRKKEAIEMEVNYGRFREFLTS